VGFISLSSALIEIIKLSVKKNGDYELGFLKCPLITIVQICTALNVSNSAAL